MRVSLMTGMQYRSDFFFGLVTGIPRTAASVATLWVVFSQRETVAGWTMHEAALVLALFLCMEALQAGILEPNLGEAVEAIRTGNLDLVLMKPADAQLLVSVRRVDPSRVWDLFAAIGVAAWGLSGVPTPGLDDLFFALVLGISGLMALYSLWIVAISASFWFVQVDNLRFLLSAVGGTGRWPVNLFPSLIRWSLLVVIPVGLVTTLPAAALLGRWTLPMVALAMGVALFNVLASRYVWIRALSSYTSASS